MHASRKCSTHGSNNQRTKDGGDIASTALVPARKHIVGRHHVCEKESPGQDAHVATATGRHGGHCSRGWPATTTFPRPARSLHSRRPSRLLQHNQRRKHGRGGSRRIQLRKACLLVRSKALSDYISSLGSQFQCNGNTDWRKRPHSLPWAQHRRNSRQRDSHPSSAAEYRATGKHFFSCSGILFNSERDGTERTVQIGLATAPPSNPTFDAAITRSSFMEMKCADSGHLHASPQRRAVVSRFASGRKGRSNRKVMYARRHWVCWHTEAGATTLMGVRTISVAHTMSTDRTTS